jgi:hypothetical protein
MVALLRSGILSLALALLLQPAPVRALDMVVGDITVADLTAYGFDGITGELTFDGGVTDEMYQMFGYLGTATGSVRIDASSFSQLSPVAQVGNTARSTLRLEDPAAAALGLASGSILVDYVFTFLDDTSALDEDTFAWHIVLTNTTASDIPLSLYTYLDLDLGGAADWNDDLATMDRGRAVVTDADDPTTMFVWNQTADGNFADHFALGGYPTVRAQLDAMGPATDLPDTTTPFGPGDFTAAYQYNLVVGAGSTASSSSSTGVVPEPNTAVLTAIGLIGLTIYGRRRKLPLS